MSLPVTGTVSYNGYTFPTETVTLGVSVRPVESQDGRANSGNRYTFRLKSKILWNGSVDNDSSLESIRERLTAYGGQFVYDDKGFGAISINTNARKGDLMWGPKPRELFWRPIGDNKAAEIIWEVEFVMSDCTETPYGRIMEMGWEADVTLGPNRLTHRTLSGFIKIPLRRFGVDNKQVFDSADNYYELVVPPIPNGWRRENERRHLSMDKCRLDFSFTDVLLEAPLPYGCIEFECDHTTANRSPMVFTMWQGTLSARYKMALGINPQMSYKHFMEMIADRTWAIRNAQKAGLPAGIIGGGIAGGMKQGILVPLNFSATERPQTREYNYSFTYWFTSGLPSIMMAGMYRPVPAGDPRGPRFANHQLWALSIKYAMLPRGYTQDAFPEQLDAIIDLCDRETSALGPVGGRAPTDGFASRIPSIYTPCPNKENSWIQYRNRIEIIVDEEVVDHRPVPRSKMNNPIPNGPGLSLGERWALQANEPSWLDKLILWAQDPNKQDGAILQRRNVPRVYIRMVGYAVRACYDVAPPKLTKIGGADVVPQNRPGHEGVVSEMIGHAGVPIIYTRWVQRWVVVGPVSTQKPMPVPPSPVIPNQDVLLKAISVVDDAVPFSNPRN